MEQLCQQELKDYVQSFIRNISIEVLSLSYKIYFIQNTSSQTLMTQSITKTRGSLAKKKDNVFA